MVQYSHIPLQSNTNPLCKIDNFSNQPFSQRDKDVVDELVELDKSDTESFAEVSESDLIALALSPTGDEDQNITKIASLPSDSTLNSVSLTEVDTVQGQ